MFAPPPKKFLEGGGKKNVHYIQPLKNYLNNSGYFGGKFSHIWGHFFSIGQICVGKILNLYFRGRFSFKRLYINLGKFMYGKSWFGPTDRPLQGTKFL